MSIDRVYFQICANSNDNSMINTRITLADAGAALAKMDNHEDVGIALIDRFWNLKRDK